MTPDPQMLPYPSSEGLDGDRFDPDYYLRSNDDVRAFGFDPADHYNRFGRAEGRPANALQAARRLSRGGRDQGAGVRLVADHRPFETSTPAAEPPESDPTLANRPAAISREAMATHPAPSTTPLDAVPDEAAAQSGAPGWFDAEWYRTQNRDVRLFGLDPFAHYAEHGWREGRSPNRAMAKLGRVSIAPQTPSTRQETAVTATIADAGLFDENWYCERYGVAPDLAIRHYVSAGAFLCYDPSPFFSSADYIKANPDIAKAGVNPLAHYIEFGFLEGRTGVKTLSETRLTTRVWLKGL